MQQPKDFYTQQLNSLQEKLARTTKRLQFLGTLRLAAFLGIIAIIYFFFHSTFVWVPAAIVLTILFFYLVATYTNVNYIKKETQELITINETEIRALNRDFHHLPNGKEFISGAHYFSNDIDLFGPRSFYQYLNRTTIEEGSKKLAAVLTSNTIDHIIEKQDVLKELSLKAKWRQLFSATAKLVKVETTTAFIINWLQQYKRFTLKKVIVLPYVFSAVSIVTIVLYATNIVSLNLLLVWFFIGLAITGKTLKQVNELSKNASNSQDTFLQYHKLLLLIENEHFNTPTLQKKFTALQHEKEKASGIIQQFSKLLSALDQRNNMLFGVFANGFLLWDLWQSIRIENWMEKYKNNVAQWFEVIAYVDAQNSLSNFVFNHPNYTFPAINSNQEATIAAENLGHPLVDEQQLVANNFTIHKSNFFIITGANMAGKSTFLRTVSLHIIMANCGLPVCATKSSYAPIKLITSMRTSDSLQDDTSYFFSELKRLKMIVDAIQEDEYFIVLDEILKGTNSKDKAEGSQKFVEKLSASKSTGIIATHDLSLCQISEENKLIKNYYFDAQIIENELYFDYKLKQGICTNMNASFLLQKMKIV
ncbi:DNA mismatch repair protein MutS [Zhouia sp. PK063]|uniref:MutS-related protein n=1 Tax=Zhouia sp. PK063 TaxID=3373602 RepID=UPI003799C303